MASESLRGKERKPDSCEFRAGLQGSPWRPQIRGPFEANRITTIAATVAVIKACSHGCGSPDTSVIAPELRANRKEPKLLLLSRQFGTWPRVCIECSLVHRMRVQLHAAKHSAQR